MLVYCPCGGIDLKLKFGMQRLRVVSSVADGVIAFCNNLLMVPMKRQNDHSKPNLFQCTHWHLTNVFKTGKVVNLPFNW